MDRPPSNVGSSTYIKRYGGWRKALKAFVQRANSEAAGEPAPDLEQSLSSSADLPDQTERAATSPARAGKPQSAKHIIERPRVTKAAPNNLKPEDRREPNIGIRFKVLQRDRFRCQLCGRSPATEPNCTLHVDHIIPFSRGGKTTYENLRVLCVECNVGKSNRNL
jgi:5-methylcytosine-specific restriction endonuclease McrA